MPEDQPVPTPETFARGILLVEPYDALCIAISSALRKFAPHHALRVTQNLADAESALESIKPELFVLDLDPPPTGEIEFFNRLRGRHPETRVLVIATNVSRGLRAARGTAGAFQFIEKPFELADFGAAVQALLGPWAQLPGKAARGTLRDLQVLDLVQLKCLALTTAVLRVEISEDEVGEIHFHNGEICHAFTDELEGVLALKEIVRWKGGKVSEASAPAKISKTIDQPWQLLLLEILPEPDENASSLGEKATRNPAQSLGKTILVIDDTEMLRVFVADVLGLAGGNFRVFTAATGVEGLQLAAAKNPDLILLDYSLTDMTGADVCRSLLEDETTARIPVLMMSGHLPELQNTARKFANVVATLAKPFLSGALIIEVEKALLAGPLPPTPSPPRPIEEANLPPANFTAPSLPNERKTGSNGDFFATAPAAPTAVVVSRTEALAPTISRISPRELPAVLANDHGVLVATLACEVISVQLAPDFRMGALQLRPAESSAIVRLNGANGSAVVPLEKDFQLGPIARNADGGIETMRLFPILPFFHPAFQGEKFAVDRVSAELGEGGRVVQLTGSKSAAMHVKLIAEFEVLRVELSEDFAIAALLLHSRSDLVRVQTGENTAFAMPFYVQDIELDDADSLVGLVVGSRR